jgi:preprotein translocase subunit SecD
VLGDQVVVSAELLRASLGIAAFAGLYYTVGMLVDATYRDEFVDELTDQMRETFAIRAEYLELRRTDRAG